MKPPSRASWAVTVALLLHACSDSSTAPGPTPPPVVGPAAAITPAALPGLHLADTPAVRVTDSAGKGISGVRVTWHERQGGGVVVPIDSITDASGLARAFWALGPAEGTNRIVGRTEGGDSVSFVVTGSVFRGQDVSSSGYLACAVTTGQLWCWGRSGPPSAALGRPVSVLDDGSVVRSPVRVGTTSMYTEVAVASNGVCALDAVGGAWCAASVGPPLAQVAGLPALRGLVSDQGYPGNVGRGLFCGVAVADSAAWCWGFTSPPARLAGSPPFRRLWFAGARHMGAHVILYNDQRGCGLLSDSSAVCWGIGAPGDGSYEGGQDTLVVVAGGHRFAELAVGDRYSCGRKVGGEVWCWGGDYSVTANYLPSLFRTDATLIGSNLSVISVYQVSREIVRRDALNPLLPWTSQDPSVILPPVEGLDGLPVLRFGRNTSNCLFLAGEDIYCTNDPYWGPITYRPVPPPVP